MIKWELVKLKEVCEFKYGSNLPSNFRIDGEYPVYGSSEIIDHHNDYLVKGPGIIIGRKGTVGKVQYSSKDFFPIDTTFYLECNLNKVDLKFLYYRLKISGLETMNSDAAVPGLNRIAAINKKINLPSLPIQQKISKILSKYDDLVEKNLKRIKLLEESARLTYEEWFLRFRIDGKKLDIDTASGLPFGWDWKSLKDFGEVVTGKTPSTGNQDYYGGNIPFVKTPSMHGNPYTLETEDYLTDLGANTQQNKFLSKNNLMVSCIGTAGVRSLVANNCQTNQQINSIKFYKDEYIFYIYAFASHLTKILDAIGSNGTTMTNVNKTKFENIKVAMPSTNLLERFHNTYSSNFKVILNLMKQNQLLKEARDMLLPYLMTGMIDSDELDIAE